MTVPLPAGLSARPATGDDIPILVELLSLTSIHDTGESDITEEDIARQFAMPGVNLSDVAWLVFNDAEKLVAAGLCVGFPPFVQLYSHVSIHPDCRDQHLIDYMMQRVFTQAETYIPNAPEDARVEIINGTDGRNKWVQQVLTSYDFEKRRAFYEMQIDMDTPPLPAHFSHGLTLRPFDPDTQQYDLYDAVEDAFRDHYGHIEREERDEEEFQRWWHNISRAGKYDPTLFFVVVDGDEIAAMSLCQPNQPSKPDTGYVSILGVRRQWRGKGLATALLYHTFGEFYQRGTLKVSLGVDAESLTGATRLYEKVGMRVVEESFMYGKCIREGVNLVKESLD